MNKKTMNTLLAGIIAVGGAAVAHNAQAMGLGENEEKCYGVVKAGMNMCGSADKAHGCAGMAKEDGTGAEWLPLPKGTCEKLVGGSLEPILPEDDAMETEQ